MCSPFWSNATIAGKSLDNHPLNYAQLVNLAAVSIGSISTRHNPLKSKRKSRKSNSTRGVDGPLRRDCAVPTAHITLRFTKSLPHPNPAAVSMCIYVLVRLKYS